MIGKPTFELRWYESGEYQEELFITKPSYGYEMKFVLQQKWIFDDGSFEWRKVDVVYFGDKQL